jgi:hypothetical protein
MPSAPVGATVTLWLADAWDMTIRPVKLRRVDWDGNPDPCGACLQPVRQRDRRYLRSQYHDERWEAEVDIAVQLANGDRPLRDVYAYADPDQRRPR